MENRIYFSDSAFSDLFNSNQQSTSKSTQATGRSPKMNAFERNQAVFAWIGLCDEPKASIYKNCLYRGFGLCFFISLIIGLLASAVYVERFVVDNLESALFGVLQICSLTAVTIPMVVTVFRRTQLMKIFNLFRQFNGNSDH